MQAWMLVRSARSHDTLPSCEGYGWVKRWMGLATACAFQCSPTVQIRSFMIMGPLLNGRVMGVPGCVFYPSKLKNGESRRRHLSLPLGFNKRYSVSPQAGINPAPAPPSPPPETETEGDTTTNNNDMGATISSLEVQSFHPDNSFKINTNLLPAQNIVPANPNHMARALKHTPSALVKGKPLIFAVMETEHPERTLERVALAGDAGGVPQRAHAPKGGGP
ncbi:hypothetical protein K438DRAFT_213773 [Mycena galopus ATCC 62051]|nr:hypothetical protein K438DRAFT_213773 [Mycena galopus ATCC 62051]